MENTSKVDGIGGVFFKSSDPDRQAAFYKKHFDINLGTWLHQNAGPSVVAAFKSETSYFGPAENRFMINFRVSDLDSLMVSLRSDGVTELGYDDEAYGRFFRFLDPEGNAVELWQPPEGELPDD
ncbi:VOC family protein [Roseibium sp.]|uniref:VOC family protein n=1 Tax=Roseibium sp. TaxID=1936156 RepID=UPI003BB13F36